MAGLKTVKRHQTFKGFETWMSGLRMSVRMHVLIIAFLIILNLAAILFIAFYWGGNIKFLWEHLDDYFIAWFKGGFKNTTMTVALLDGVPREYYAWYVRDYLRIVFFEEWATLRPLLPYSFLVYPLGYFLILVIFRLRASREFGLQHLRGPQLVTADEHRKCVKKEEEEADINIGEVKLPVSMECQHVYIIGTTGTGKTTFMLQAIERLRQRQERGIIYDFKGDFVSRFYDSSTDFIINPVDSRCAGWSLFNELESQIDIEAMCHSLFPPGLREEDTYFNGTARDVFKGILQYLHGEGKTSNMDLWNAARDIHKFLSSFEGGRVGLRHIDDPEGKQARGILSTMLKFTSPLRFMSGVDGGFSIKEWVKNGKGWLYVVNNQKAKDTLRPILSLAVDLVAREILSLDDDRDRRIFMFVDELGTLQNLPSLIDILTLGRSKGASVWLGTQDFGRIKQIYGEDIAETIFNNCSTRICYRVNAPATARFLEDAFGEREISEVEESHSMGPDDGKDGLSLARRKKTEKIIMASEIMELPNLHCYAKMGHFNTTKTRITYKQYPVKNDILMLRKDLLLSKPPKKNEEELCGIDLDAFFGSPRK